MIMITKTLTATFSLCLVAAGLLGQSSHQPVQNKVSKDASIKQFIGTWKAVCADGKAFVVLVLNQAGTDVGGTISIGNFTGQEGQCTSVVAAPTEAHANEVN
jgi:hypothetical protein